MASAKDVLKQIKDNDVEWVDLRFTDPRASGSTSPCALACIGEDELEDGLMFDGSSIAGWKAINESDMILKPDPDAVYIDPFSATPMLIISAISSSPRPASSTPATRARPPSAPRPIVKVAGIGDTVYVGPEAEFFMFDDVRFYDGYDVQRASSIDDIELPTNTGPNTKAATSATVRAPRAAISPSRRSTAAVDIRGEMARPCSKWACPATSTTTKSPRPSTSSA
jgi:glutamine synthetase